MQLKSFFTITCLLMVTVLAGCRVTDLDRDGISRIDNVGLVRAQHYNLIQDGRHAIPAIPKHKIAPHYRRQIVNYPTRQEPGTILVDTKAKHLYYVMEKGKAMRYGIGVGRDGFHWVGNATVGMKREWPSWTPPAPMIKRQPHLVKYAGGMRGGLNNPLGARALYLYRNGRDTLYRLHGTPEWWTIGTHASSGCIRLMNHDIIDLYNRTKVGARVIVL